MSDEFSIVDPRDRPMEPFNTCDISHRKLTEALGCTEMRANQVIVEPGEIATPHTHEGQEEVFVALTGGHIAIEGEVYDVPAGGLVRVAPETVRNLRNETDDTTHLWLAFGAPPVGTIDDFGAYVIPDDQD